MLRQQEVEHDQLVASRAGQLERPDPVRGAVDLEPLGRERAGDEADDPRLVVDHQHPRHAADARPDAGRRDSPHDGAVIGSRRPHDRGMTVP